MQCWSSANVVVLDMDSSTQVGVDWLNCLVSFPDKTPKLKLVETLKWCASIFGISVPFSRVNYGSKIPSRKLLRCKGSITIKACVRDSRFVWFSKKPGYQGQSHSNPFFFVFFGCVVTGICFFCWNFQWHSHRSSKTMICVFRDENLTAWVDMSWSYAWESSDFIPQTCHCLKRVHTHRTHPKIIAHSQIAL